MSTVDQLAQDSVRPTRIAPAPLGSLPGRRAPLGVRAGQIVAAQLAVALLLFAWGRGALILLAAGCVAVVLVGAAWIRFRGRWLFEWSNIGVRFLTSRHTLAPDTTPDALLDLVAPGTTMATTELAGSSAAVLSDGYGLTAVLELGDAAELLADDSLTLPTPASLLPAPGAETPPIRIQMLLAGAPAPVPGTTGGIPATSYRQLTDGRLLRHERALLAVRVLRVTNWTDEELHRALSSAVRKIRRRLNPIPTRVLGESAAARVIAELAHYDAVTPVQESWQSVQLGGLWQATYRLHRWTDPQLESARWLVPRMMALPAMATTVSLTAGPWPIGSADNVPVDFTVRLAAASAADLATAAQALRRLLTGERFGGQRLDGEHLSGVAATLPFGTAGVRPGVPVKALTLSPPTLDRLKLPLGMAGLMLGANRQGGAVIAQLFRAKTTDVVLVGGIRAAQLVVLRAMALGARIVVQTTRPRSWEPFVRGSSAPGEILVIPPGRPVGGPPGTPLRPLLLVIDTGPVASGSPPGPGWQANLVIRDELTAADIDLVSRADLAILQPLRPAEAALAGTALGLGESSEWLTRMRADMVGVVNRRSLRWALLSVTPIESQLVGPPGRV